MSQATRFPAGEVAGSAGQGHVPAITAFQCQPASKMLADLAIFLLPKALISGHPAECGYHVGRVFA